MLFFKRLGASKRVIVEGAKKPVAQELQHVVVGGPPHVVTQTTNKVAEGVSSGTSSTATMATERLICASIWGQPHRFAESPSRPSKMDQILVAIQAQNHPKYSPD